MRWAALVCLVWPIVVRATLTAEPLPYWSLDPMTVFAPPVGLTPFWALMLDAMMALGALLALIADRRAGHSPLARPFGIASLGILAVVAHVLQGSDRLEQLVVGSSWCAAMLGGLGAATLARTAVFRKLLVALVLGFIMLVIAKGTVQVFVEHPATLEQYNANRTDFLAANGWTPDSAQARMYERRLRQPDATGWFGMSNVFASLCACGFVAFVGLLIGTVRRSKNYESPTGPMPALVFGAAAIACGFGLTQAGSKGGFAAAALGLVLLAIGHFAARVPRRLGGWIGLGAVALPLAAVVARGAIGERIGELSLLFRWFYMKAALVIAGQNPLLGVGPAGFKDAFVGVKDPLCPEEVTSPHSVLLDWIATLGLGGAAWAVLLLGAAWMLGTQLAAHGSDDTPDDDQPRARRAMLLVAIVPVFIGAMVEAPMATIEGAATRLIGLAGWVVVAWCVFEALDRAPRLFGVVSAAALALIAHAQIELTFVHAGSVGWCALLIGACCPLRSATRSADRWAGIAMVGASVLIVWMPFMVPVWRWEQEVVRAGQTLRPAAELTARFHSLDAKNDDVRAVRAELEILLGSPVAAHEIDVALDRLWLDLTGDASASLGRAGKLWPGHLATSRAAGRLELERLRLADSLGQDTAPIRGRAAELADNAIRRLPGSARAWHWSGRMAGALAASGGPPTRADAIVLLERAAQLDPWGLAHALALFEAWTAADDRENAIRWGRRALEINELLRLDPLRGLTDSQRNRIRRFIENP